MLVDIVINRWTLSATNRAWYRRYEAMSQAEQR